MASPALTMSAEEKKSRAAFKKAATLNFLASGETYTTLAVAAELLQTSERNALRLLQRLTTEKLIKVDEKVIPNSTLKLYGISAHGLAMCETSHPLAREFFIGKTNPSWVPHHIDGQLIRINAERSGWTEYLPGKLLMVANASRWKQIPDALITRPDKRRVAVEVERFVKSRKRMIEVVGGHLAQIVQKKYDMVYYFTPHKAALDRAFAGISTVLLDGSKVTLTDSHKARFKVFDIKSWRGEI